ncbi:MAG TPA: hypothetical protein VFM61_09515, partial [Pseudidiomarina sp.]|nr:hypothetical protein [Pseudidiomarina sp.]
MMMSGWRILVAILLTAATTSVSASTTSVAAPWQLPFDRTRWLQQWVTPQLLDPLQRYVEASCPNPMVVWVPTAVIQSE